MSNDGIRTIGVIGAGQMGSGIAHVAALAGYDVRLSDVDPKALERAVQAIDRNLARQVARGKIKDEERVGALKHIASGPGYEWLADCDVVIEAATEREETKREIYKKLMPSLKESAIVASNTSSISITRLAAATGRPERFIGMHFMNPVPVMQLVELIRGIATDEATFTAIHEAFTRAFRDQFGLTPETVRARRHLETIDLVEPIMMNETPFATLEPPRFETGKPLLIAGLGARYNHETSAGIPAQWQRFASYIGHIPGQVGRVAYGVLCNADDSGNMDYICGVEVSDFSELPPELSRVRIPQQKYAVFLHRDHISTIRRSWHAIWSAWLPNSGYENADAPDFERYTESFDAERGTGGVEIWLPLKA
jgi:AraC family transcriptional regulator